MSSYSIISYPGSELPKAYINMIYSKWLRANRYGNDFYKLCDSDSYFAHYQKYITSLLHKPNCIIRLAVLTEDPDVVLGFSVSRGDDDNILDFVHVHKDMRKQGIGRSLVPVDTIDTITHLTTIGMAIWASKHPTWRLNPFI